ncbi:MAG: hypothetical protein M3069_24020 [Chloroflexota bacterium]|nr:hypothetical protein [Chloroflexota bacterium]
MRLLLLIPILMVAFLVFSVGGLFVGEMGEFGEFGARGPLLAGWPVLLIGLGMWMFLHEDGRHARREGWANGPRGLKPHAGSEQQSKGKPSAATRDPLELHQSQLPVDVEVKVQQIRRKVDVLLTYADRFPPFSQDLYLVRQTASDYLPRTISAYLALPKDTASDKPVSADGTSAYQELKAQLDLLDSKLDDIAQDLERQDTDRLLANRRFLEARFGSRTAKPVGDPDGAGVA